MKNYLQQNKYSEVNIIEHKHGHHDEMKTSTEYTKRKHRITQDEGRQTKEIELRKLRKSSAKSLQTDMNKHTTTEMRK